MTRASTVTAQRTCAICERTLLTGERPLRYSPGGEEYVDVCPLCQEVAVEYGWLKEGSPTTPVVPVERRRRRLLSFLDRKETGEVPVASEPILRRLSDKEQAMVEAADLFNGSAFRRTIAGIAKSLGSPTVSIVPLSGVNSEVVITIAWDLSWYQYRIAPESGQQVRLAERGHELREVDPVYREWNGKLLEDGRLAPDISPV
jgi:hypothetical protein